MDALASLLLFQAFRGEYPKVAGFEEVGAWDCPIR